MASDERIERERNKSTPSIKKPRYVKQQPTVLAKEGRGQFKCQYCEKIYSSERIMINHMCEQRRRFNQKELPHAQNGLQAYLAIFSAFYGKTHGKTEEDFRHSDYYLACVRWGRFVIDVNCLNKSKYLKWLLKCSVPIEDWTKDSTYESWLKEVVYQEDAWDAMERSIITMTKWGESSNLPYYDYFRSSNGARTIHDIRRGAITGWVIFCSESGRAWLNSVDASELDTIWDWINVPAWSVKLSQDSEITKSIMDICSKTGM